MFDEREEGQLEGNGGLKNRAFARCLHEVVARGVAEDFINDDLG